MIYVGTNGTIELLDYENNYNQFWNVRADCEQVNIVSTLFETQNGYDLVRVDGIQYSGSMLVDLVLPSSFIVSFVSDEWTTGSGFSLDWKCYDEPAHSGTNKQFK